MNFEINTQTLKDAVSKLLPIIDKRSARPILTNCIFEISDTTLTLVASDLEVSAKVILQIQNRDNANISFCINVKHLFDILRELPQETLEFNLDNNQNLMNLRCGKIKYSLLISSSDDYPKINFQHSSDHFSISASNLLEMISKTSFAISSDETRLFLNGIYLHSKEGSLRAVAIDGHRLALFDSDSWENKSTDIEAGIIVPKKGVFEIKRMAESQGQSNIQITLDESFLNAQIDDSYYLNIRLISRDYPKYESIIPNKTAYRLTVDKNQMINAVRRIKILSNKKTNGIKFKAKDDSLELSSNHVSLGSAREMVNANYSGEEVEIGLNARYLLDALSVLREGDVHLEFTNALSPIILKSAQNPEFLGMIMPLRL
jgi:DNA polymerase-3 subunit beta